MQYIRSEDYKYIMQKYADYPKSVHGRNRFVRQDRIFDEKTGLDGDFILSEIDKIDEANANLPHPVRKALALSYVLKNTRISCDPRDPFPAIHMVDRPLQKTLLGKWRSEIFGGVIADVEKRRAQLERDGIVTIWPDFDHSVPNWDRLFALGLPGILAESEAIRKASVLNEEEEAFFEGIRITYEAVIAFFGRLEALARETKGSERLADALASLQKGAPQSFYEALVLDYLYFMISEHVDILQVRSLSNFDRLLNSFYQKDLARGISDEALREDLAYFLLQYTAIGNYWNQPVYLGGENADGSTVINDLSYTFLDVYDKMGIFNPKIQIKVADSTPRAFLEKALDMVRRGHNCIVFVSDKTIRRALVRAGISEEDARLCDVKGCYEYSVIESYQTGMIYANMMKPLEYALHKGCDGVTGVFSGNESPAPETYKSFDAFKEEYKKQLLNVIHAAMETVNGFEDYLHVINPLSLLSGTFKSCLEKKKDAIGGGGKENGTTMSFGFLADASDSLAMIEKYVFEKKVITLPELVTALDRNFEGYEKLRLKLWNDPEKYGNNKDRPDKIAVELTEFIAANVCGIPNAKGRGGNWTANYHVARMSYVQGAKTAASPNGRRLGEELSKNASASMGQNREGATAAVLSLTKIDATAFTGDASLDMGLLPSAVKGEDGLAAMYGILMTFCRRGGHAVHINVFDADTLRDAQAHPEKYQDLQIRVCGWNVLWNDICKEEQDGFIRQAEALI